MKIGPFEARDLAALFTPPSAVYKGVRLLLGRRTVAGHDPDERDPAFIVEALAFIEPVLRHYFRAEVRGGENLPATGPALVVGNHSGGLQTVETLLLVREVLRRHGPERELYGLGHDMALDEPTLARYAVKLGVLRASWDSARLAFRRGALALVYPGGDEDSGRPWSERNRVVFAHRTGFIRLALTERVPIVPVVTAGAHEVFVVLTRGRWLARMLGLPRLRVTVFPLALMLPWGLAPVCLPYLPLPARMVTRFGAPIQFEPCGPEAASDPAYVEACYERVRSTMQAMLDGLAAERRWPVLG